jgi:hypothetical protein
VDDRIHPLEKLAPPLKRSKVGHGRHARQARQEVTGDRNDIPARVPEPFCKRPSYEATGSSHEDSCHRAAPAGLDSAAFTTAAR